MVKNTALSQAVVIHNFNPSTQEAETGRSPARRGPCLKNQKQNKKDRSWEWWLTLLIPALGMWRQEWCGWAERNVRWEETLHSA